MKMKKSKEKESIEILKLLVSLKYAVTLKISLKKNNPRI